jgi:hypothetical protein
VTARLDPRLRKAADRCRGEGWKVTPTAAGSVGGVGHGRVWLVRPKGAVTVAPQRMSDAELLAFAGMNDADRAIEVAVEPVEPDPPLADVVERIRAGTFYEDYDWAAGPGLRVLGRAQAALQGVM